MIKQLAKPDAKAVDLLLNQVSRDPNDSSYAHPDQEVSARVPYVEKVLNLLSLLPAEDPAADLLDRTMARIASAGMHAPGTTDRPMDQYGPNV